MTTRQLRRAAAMSEVVPEPRDVRSGEGKESARTRRVLRSVGWQSVSQSHWRRTRPATTAFNARAEAARFRPCLMRAPARRS